MRPNRVPAVALALAVTLAGTAFAGEIYGKITANNTAVPEGAEVAVTCGDRTFGPVKTDKGGSYHVVAEATGKCTLKVTVKGQTASISVASYDDGVQVDLVLEQKDGKLTLKRK